MYATHLNNMLRCTLVEQCCCCCRASKCEDCFDSPICCWCFLYCVGLSTHLPLCILPPLTSHIHLLITRSLACPTTHTPIHPPAHPPTLSPAHPTTHLLTCSLARQPTHPPTHLPTHRHLCPPTHPPTCLPSHSHTQFISENCDFRDSAICCFCA